MGYLFWKIFGWFLLTVTFLVLLLFSLGLLSPPQALKQNMLLLQQQRLDAVAALLQNQDLQATREFLRRQQQIRPQIWVWDDPDEDILGRNIPGFILRLPPERRLQTTVKHQNTTYTLRLFRPAKDLRSRSFLPFSSPEGFPDKQAPRYLRWLVFVLVGLAASAWLAWYLTRPVRILSQATKTLSKGESISEIRPRLGRRKDELVDLAADFDAMAGALQHKQDTLDQLLKDISHELRSPLTRVRLALGLLEKQQRPLNTDDHQQISHELDRLDDLIDQVLTLTQLDTRQLHELDDYIDIGDFTARLADKLSLEAEQRHCAIRVDNQAGETVLPVNQELLSRALENIIRNAIAHSPDDSLIDIQLLKQNQTLMISIRDQGTGVADNQLEDIFKPFVRLDNARRRGGYGLGLAIAQRAVRQHKGEISARNHSAGGLEVTLKIPITSSNQIT